MAVDGTLMFPTGERFAVTLRHSTPAHARAPSNYSRRSDCQQRDEFLPRIQRENVIVAQSSTEHQMGINMSMYTRELRRASDDVTMTNLPLLLDESRLRRNNFRRLA
ncbi:hypothetical protein EVAR_98192_1 [Eumeta japonica]|uniref:Uncharacterized protein n=1 Tax=Eumeta variegata TaxID=151549 RepID=A0A4C1SH51_EUMVA|nr:hypothetical protein EVAR_98192_1 [Eumeta japonica]